MALDFWVGPRPFKPKRRVRFPYAIPSFRMRSANFIHLTFNQNRKKASCFILFPDGVVVTQLTLTQSSQVRILVGVPNLCRSSSLGGQRIVYPIKASSILVCGASLWRVNWAGPSSVLKTEGLRKRIEFDSTSPPPI